MQQKQYTSTDCVVNQVRIADWTPTCVAITSYDQFEAWVLIPPMTFSRQILIISLLRSRSVLFRYHSVRRCPRSYSCCKGSCCERLWLLPLNVARSLPSDVEMEPYTKVAISFSNHTNLFNSFYLSNITTVDPFYR